MLFFPLHWTYFTTQTFWVVWQTVLSFLLPVLTIFTCWAVMIHHFLTRDLNRWKIIYLFNIATFSRSVLKSVTIKAMCVTGFFLICTFPFCIVFFMVGCRINEKNLKSEAFYSKEGIIILQDIKILHKGTMPLMLANRFDIMYMTLNETTCGLYLGLPEAIFYHSSIHHDWYSIYIQYWYILVLSTLSVIISSVIQPFLYVLINSQLRERLFRLVSTSASPIFTKYFMIFPLWVVRWFYNYLLGGGSSSII